MEHPVDENNYPLFDGLVGLKQNPMKTAIQELIEFIDDKFIVSNSPQISFIYCKAQELLEKEKEQSIELIKQTAMFMAASNLDEDISKMSYEDVYNSYYNPTYKL